MNNERIAEMFEQLADLLEFRGDNPFRTRAYRNASKAIRELGEPVSQILADTTRKLQDIEGIGEAVAEKCQVIVDSGVLPQLEELKQVIPETVLDLMKVPGLGPKKAKALYETLQIATLDQLKQACEAGQISTLKGFGKKTEQTILAGIQLAQTSSLRQLWAKVDRVVQQLKTHLSTCNAIQQMEFAGSYRRGKETVGDLDILVSATDFNAVMDRLAVFPDVEQVLARGDTKMSVRLFSRLQVDLRVVPQESFGAALQYFTGSKEHTVIVRNRAKQLGLKINEWGVYRISDDTKIAGATEEDVYASVGLPWFDPAIREARHEFEWAEQGALPKLIDTKDIRGDLHMHTTASDGSASIAEMVAAAKLCGLDYIAITDHSKRVSLANGLTSERVLAQWKEIDFFNEQHGGDFLVLKGIECDILENGDLDLPDDVLAQADWVTASIHYGQQQPARQITDRLLGAISHPSISAISHPTGRLLNEREPYDVLLEEVYSAAAKYGKFLELNASPKRLDLNDLQCSIAKSHGILIVINTDAHSPEGLMSMRYGIMQARRAGLTAKDVANARPWKEMKRLIGKSA
jgi:DNA polymerase (family X)